MKSVERQVEEHLKLLRKRWHVGISKFKERIDDFIQNQKKLNRKKRPPKCIRTAIYGDIYLDERELLLIDSFYLQRLKGISNMGFVNYVYPEARHSRFEHSLGVFWIIKKLLDSPFWQEKNNIKKDNDYNMNLKCAAILHDIGHGPLSHCTEYILKCLGIDDVLRNPLKNCSKPHERRTREIILDRDFQLGILNKKKYYLREALEILGADPTTVSKMIVGDKKKSPFTPLINGPVDADKLDYYQRDAFFTGVPAGNIDAEFLMRLLKYDKNEGLYFVSKSFGTLIQMLFNREYIYSAVPHYPVVRIAQSMFVIAFLMALSCLDVDVQIDILFHLEMMDDGDLWTILDIVSSSEPSNKIKERHNILQNLLYSLRSRVLYKRLATLSLDDCNKYGFGRLKKEKKLWKSNSEQYIDNDLFPISYLTLKDLESSNIEKIEDNELIIFEITPEPEIIKDRKLEINRNLKEIKIECEDNKIYPIYKKLGNSRRAIVDGYAHFQHLLNKAILLHPKTRGVDKKKLKPLASQFKKKKNPLFLIEYDLKSLAKKRLRELKINERRQKMEDI